MLRKVNDPPFSLRNKQFPLYGEFPLLSMRQWTVFSDALLADEKTNAIIIEIIFFAIIVNVHSHHWMELLSAFDFI